MLLTEFDQKKHDKNMWQEGREYGYSEGHESGYSEGHESGYSEGHESGYSEGRESGYSEGRESGYTEGREMTIEIIKAINEGNVTVDSLIKMGFDSELVKDILDKYK